MKQKAYLALDLGASNGRAVLGRLKDGRLSMEEVGRFPNGPVTLTRTMYWDVLALWAHILDVLRNCARSGLRLSSIGVDTWGADFGLLDRSGRLLANPLCYRDSRTEGIGKILGRKFPHEKFYGICGQDFNRIMVLSHLVAVKRDTPRVLDAAASLLMTPDLMRYFLCGRKATELTMAGTSQLIDISSRRWSPSILRACGLPARILTPLTRAGHIAGPLSADVAAETGLGGVPVAVVAGHDTASAAAAAPLAGDDTVFLNSGTWSIFGLAMDKPLLSADARRMGFINELGFDSVLFVKNLAGLYLVENLKREYAKTGREFTYEQIISAASRATQFRFFIDMNAPVFFSGRDVEASSLSFLRATRQRGQPGFGELVRSLLESLVFSYRETLVQLGQVTGRTFRRICIVGGGVRNRLVCQWTADATGLPVFAGPVEATVAGNLAFQVMADGGAKNLEDIKCLIARSFKSQAYMPRGTDEWKRAFDRFESIRQQNRK